MQAPGGVLFGVGAPGPISLVAHPRIPPCVVASLRFGLAPSLISNFASKTGDFASSCPLFKIIERPNHSRKHLFQTY